MLSLQPKIVVQSLKTELQLCATRINGDIRRRSLAAFQLAVGLISGAFGELDYAEGLPWLLQSARLGCIPAKAAIKRAYDAFDIPVPEAEETISEWLFDGVVNGFVEARNDLIRSNVSLYEEALRVLCFKRVGTGKLLPSDSNKIEDFILALREKNVLIHDPQPSQAQGILHYLAFYGYCDEIETIVRIIPYNDVQDGVGQTPLFLACLAGHSQVAMLLLDHGASAGKADFQGVTPLHLLSSFDARDTAAIAQMMMKNGGRLNARSKTLGQFPSQTLGKHDGTPLLWAVAGGSLSAVEILMEHRADPFDEAGMAIETNGKYYWCPVHLAAAEHRYDMLEVLLSSSGGFLGPSKLNTCFRQYGQEISEKLLPLFWATSFKTLSFFDRIILHGSNFKEAAKKTISMLVRLGADPFKCSPSGRPESMLIADPCTIMPDILEYLLSQEFGVFIGDKPRIFHAVVRTIGMSNKLNFQILLEQLQREEIEELQDRCNIDLLLVAADLAPDPFFVERLLVHGLVPHHQHFHAAVIRHHFSTADQLLAAGVDKNVRENGVALLGRLIRSATQQRVPAIEYMLSVCDGESEEDFIVASGTGFRLSALHYAATMSNMESQVVVRYIVNKIVRTFPTESFINMQVPGSGWTALHLAVVYGNFEVVRFLLDLPELDVNVRDEYGRTAYDLAAYRIKDPEFDGFIEVPLEFRADIGTQQQSTTKDLLRLFVNHGEAETNMYNFVMERTVDSINFLSLGGEPREVQVLVNEGESQRLHWS